MHLTLQSYVTPYAVLFASHKSPSLRPMPYPRIARLVVFCLLPGAAVGGVSQKPQSPPATLLNPQELVREVVENELRQKDLPIHWTFRELVYKDGSVETREVCQTNAGTIDRLVAINDQPLSAEQQRREDVRIQSFLGDPSEIRKERQKQREDSAKQYRMFATFPDAFRYEYSGTEGDLVKLRFEPNPRFIPSSRQEEVFHHLEGIMWIDPNQKQMARIDGELTNEVRFAGGLLGHLDKGGIFSVQFEHLDSGQWVMAALHVEMNGKALIFKTIAVQEKRDFDNYRRVPDDLTLSQGAQLLEKAPSSPRQSAANTSQ